jgi:hypothetical protein
MFSSQKEKDLLTRQPALPHGTEGILSSAFTLLASSLISTHVIEVINCLRLRSTVTAASAPPPPPAQRPGGAEAIKLLPNRTRVRNVMVFAGLTAFTGVTYFWTMYQMKAKDPLAEVEQEAQVSFKFSHNQHRVLAQCSCKG